MKAHLWKPRVLATLAGLAAVLTMTGCGASNQVSGNTAGSNGSTPMQWSSPPPMQIDTSKQYSAIVHTNYGDFTIQLFAKHAPHTVNNFVFLADHKYYQNNEFFRIIKTFMIQTGDPSNTGTGSPGYTFNDELPPKEPYGPGIVAMANAGPNTNGSQFFICTGPDSTGLPPQYTEFGKVVQGMAVVQKIAAIPVVANPNMQNEVSKPTQKAYIESIDIQVK